MNYKKFWFKYSRVIIGGAMLLLLVLMAVCAPLLASHDAAVDIHMKEALTPPCAEQLCGTDSMGRDVFARIVYGARVSLTIAISVLAVIGVFGTVLGLLAG